MTSVLDSGASPEIAVRALRAGTTQVHLTVSYGTEDICTCPDGSMFYLVGPTLTARSQGFTLEVLPELTPTATATAAETPTPMPTSTASATATMSRRGSSDGGCSMQTSSGSWSSLLLIFLFFGLRSVRDWSHPRR